MREFIEFHSYRLPSEDGLYDFIRRPCLVRHFNGQVRYQTQYNEDGTFKCLMPIKQYDYIEMINFFYPDEDFSHILIDCDTNRLVFDFDKIISVVNLNKNYISSIEESL